MQGKTESVPEEIDHGRRKITLLTRAAIVNYSPFTVVEAPVPQANRSSGFSMTTALRLWTPEMDTEYQPHCGKSLMQCYATQKFDKTQEINFTPRT